MRVLITGGSGFVGQHLKVLFNEPIITSNTILTDADPKITKLDVKDSTECENVLETFKPAVVIHLAALAYVPDCEQNPLNAFQTNTQGTANLLCAINKISPTTKFLFISTSEVYKFSDEALTEAAHLEIRHKYAASKLAAEQIVQSFSNLTTIIARPFPHLGAGQSPNFAISAFAKKLVQIKRGETEPVIEVGNLFPERDYSDVRDIVKGYETLTRLGKKGQTYNLASGKGVAIEELLKLLIKIAEVEVEIKIDPKKVRPNEPKRIIGSIEKIRGELGWHPEICLENSLKNVFEFWQNAAENSQVFNN